MIYKVYYQETKSETQKETQKSLYMEADSDVIVRQLVEENTPYNIEYVQLLDENILLTSKNMRTSLGVLT